MQAEGLQRLKYDGFDLQDVIIRDPYYENAFKKKLDYLFSLETDRLLAGFYETRGFKAKAERYPGWESLEIQGTLWAIILWRCLRPMHLQNRLKFWTEYAI